MDIIYSVPPDIIRVILAASGINNGVTFAAWKDALSFLWVCRQWRLAAKPILFNILVCEKHFKTARDYGVYYDKSEAHSNVTLLFKCNYMEGVTKIAIHISAFYNSGVDILMCLGEAFDDEDGAEDMKSLKIVKNRGVVRERCPRHSHHLDSNCAGDNACCTGGYISQKLYDRDELKALRRDASTNIASKLMLLIPNVTHLIIKTNELSPTYTILTDMFVNNYMAQLVKLECNLRGIDLQLKDGYNIQSLTLKNYNAACGQIAQLPTNVVKNLSLSFEGGFNWNLFKRGDIAPVSYDNLVCLELSGDVIESDDIVDNSFSNTSAETLPLVVFPKLQVLAIRHMNIPYDSLKYLLEFPVKSLYVTGCIHLLERLCKQNLDKLESLVITYLCCHCDIDCIYNESDDNSYDDNYDDAEDIESMVTQVTNKLFARTSNCTKMYFYIDLDTHYIDWRETTWIHLTHLCVATIDIVDHITKIIPNMPNLLYLAIMLTNSLSWRDLDRMITFISKMKRECTQPTQSKIRRIVIEGIEEEFYLKFVGALQFFKWYFPELRDITVLRGRTTYF